MRQNYQPAAVRLQLALLFSVRLLGEECEFQVQLAMRADLPIALRATFARQKMHGRKPPTRGRLGS